MADLKNLFLITKHHIFLASLFLLSSSLLPVLSPSLIVSSFTSRLLTAANFFSSPSPTQAASDTATLYSVSPRRIRIEDESKKIDHATRELTSCDIFDGSWVSDDTEPVYSPGYCPFVEDKFNCFKTRTEFLGFLGEKVIYITKGSTVSDSK